MDNAVPLHESVAARPHPKPQGSQGWSAFFQSLGQNGPDHRPPVAPPVEPTSISRFATSA